MLRPHVIHGVMSVVFYQRGHRVWDEFHKAYLVHRWFSTGMTTSWPDDAFLPLWQALPDPPTTEDANGAEESV